MREHNLESATQQPTNKPWRSCLLSGVVFLILLMCYVFMPLGSESPFQQDAFDQVVTRIENKTLRPDAKGIVVLPPEYQSLTVTGRVYVSHGDTSKLLIFFPSWIGRQRLWQDDWWMCGYLYDAGSSVTKQVGEANGWSEIIEPKHVAPWNAKQDRDIEGRSIPTLTTHRYSTHWFAIEDLPS